MPRHDFLRALARLCLLAGLGLAAAAAAEPPTLFKDLAPGTAEDEGSSPGVPTPFEGPFPVVDESVFFLVRGAGSVLWTSDGTAEGTRRLRAVCVETSCTLEASNRARRLELVAARLLRLRRRRLLPGRRLGPRQRALGSHRRLRV